MRILVIIISALLVAGGSGFYLLQGLRSEQPVMAEPVEAPRPVQVLVPAVALTAGSILTPEHIQSAPIGRDAMTDEMIEANEEGRKFLLGSVALHPLPKGMPIARSAVVNPGERGFLAAVLPKGMRAISIPINEVGGLSGLVMPGDRVDIILTYSVEGSVIDAGRDIRASETVLTNLRVLALDQRMQAGESLAQQVNPTEMRPIARAATLEVTPDQAEMLTLATRLGDLSLVLNSVQDGGDRVAEAEGETATSSLATLAAAASGRPLPAASRRPLTLDSQVTSLLQRELALMAGAEAPAAGDAHALRPLPERITRVQVVRGINTGALEFSGALGESGEPIGDLPAVDAATGLSLGEAVASIAAD